MGILLNKNTRVMVQGITGREGKFHTRKMREYGTHMVAGVTPGKGGTTVDSIPVFDTVKEAVEKTGANASVILVPSRFASDAMLEAVVAGIRLMVCITEGVPIQDMIRVKEKVLQTATVLIGPNCPGLITVGEAKMGIMPGHIFSPGRVGLISRSGTLTYQVVDELTRAGWGQSTCVGIGGDPILGSDFVSILKFFKDDPQTDLVLLIGEIGGSMEEESAEFIKENKMKVVSFIAGKTAPPGKRMGHAGAIVSGSSGTAQAKIDALTRAGVPVADTTSELVEIVRSLLEGISP